MVDLKGVCEWVSKSSGYVAKKSFNWFLTCFIVNFGSTIPFERVWEMWCEIHICLFCVWSACVRECEWCRNYDVREYHLLNVWTKLDLRTHTFNNIYKYYYFYILNSIK